MLAQLLFLISSLSVNLAWDASPNAVSGYSVYVGQSPRNYNQKIDVGNALSVSLDGFVPSIPYYFSATATANGLESDYSNEINKTFPLPDIKLNLDSSGLLSANFFAGGTFDVLKSTDLKKWTLFQTTEQIQDSYFAQISPEPTAFFRSQFKSAKALPITIKSTPMVRVSKSMIPQGPPTPPKITFFQKLRLFLRYRPGHHVGDKKGAELLKE